MIIPAKKTFNMTQSRKRQRPVLNRRSRSGLCVDVDSIIPH